MKKTVTANISGVVFHIDEDAYDKLNVYLASIREKLSTEHGRDEILSDIEGRIAEMLQEKLSAMKKVITIDDVKDVIEQLGEPEQFEETTEAAGSQTYTGYYEERTAKRLYRDPDDKYISGVSGGLGAYFSIDPIWIRIAFVVTTFVYGFGPILYIILWIVVPKARTTAEKLEMRGRKVNLSNIEKSIKDELSDLKKNFREFSEETKQHLKKKEKNKMVVDNSSRVAADLLKAFSKVAGVFLIIITFTLLLGLISGTYMIPLGILEAHGVWLLSIPDILSAILTSEIWVQTTMVALLVLVGVPIFWMFMVGIQLLFEVNTTSKYFAAFTFVVWLAAAGTIALSAVNGVRNFTGEHSSSHDYILSDTTWPNLYIQVNETMLREQAIPQNQHKASAWHMMWQEDGNRAMGQPRLRIKTSTNESIVLEVTRHSRGITPQQASYNAQAIEYAFIQQDSLLILDPVFYFNKEDGWRDQEIHLELSIPEDKIAVVHKNLRRNMPVRWNDTVQILEN